MTENSKITNAWRERAEKELKGRNPDDLAWDTLEGIRVKPLYTEADTRGACRTWAPRRGSSPSRAG
jgi:methylmalonyl-CoA mutase